MRWLILRRAQHERALLLALLISVAVPTATNAAGICPLGEGERIASSIAGPYSITVAVQPPQPVVGDLRLAVSLCDAATNAPVEHANVTLTPVNAAGAAGRPALAFTRGTPNEYDAALTVNDPGLWRYRVHASAAQGEADLEVPLDVRAPTERSDPAAGLVFFGVSAVLVAGGLYIARSARATLKRR